MKILAVDDKKMPLEALTEAIQIVKPEAEVYSFRNPSEALSFVDKIPCDIAFLDIDMHSMNGIDLAKRLKQKKHDINIIFATGYNEYAGDALDLHCSGYLMKPITPEKVQKELDDLRHPVQIRSKKRVRVQTFGNFEVFVDEEPVRFKYEKTKEMLAYLVDRRGTLCTNGEIMAVLWSDDSHFSYFRSLKKDLFDTMKQKGCMDLFHQQWGKFGIVEETVDCDYYEWIKGNVEYINRYQGEYMAQYSWSEFRNANLEDDREKIMCNTFTTQDLI